MYVGLLRTVVKIRSFIIVSSSISMTIPSKRRHDRIKLAVPKVLQVNPPKSPIGSTNSHSKSQFNSHLILIRHINLSRPTHIIRIVLIAIPSRRTTPRLLNIIHSTITTATSTFPRSSRWWSISDVGFTSTTKSTRKTENMP